MEQLNAAPEKFKIVKLKPVVQAIDQMKNNLPIISAGLLVVGSINLVCFYVIFGVDIMTYLDFTEVFQIQFVFYIFSCVIIAIFYLYTYHPGILSVSDLTFAYYYRGLKPFRDDDDKKHYEKIKNKRAIESNKKIILFTRPFIILL